MRTSRKLEKNIRASLSGSDRLLLVETWIKLVTDYSVIDGALSVFEWIEFGEYGISLFTIY